MLLRYAESIASVNTLRLLGCCNDAHKTEGHFHSNTNEFRPTPHGVPGCKVQEQLHAAGEESDDPVINEAPRNEVV
jgi:hypothetical protein